MSEVAYDSRPDTLDHIQRVAELLDEVRENLRLRALRHDASKLASPEREMFDRYTMRLRELDYDSPEYRAVLAEMRADALQHHYEANDHHPEHHEDGIHGMHLLQLVEMLADWKAAGERHANSEGLEASIMANAARFGYGEHTVHVLLATARELGWL